MDQPAGPEGKEKDADEYEGSTEPDPETERSPVTAEAEVTAEWEPHKPVGEEVTKHGRAGVPGAAESTGGDGLQAIEELESGPSGKKGDSGVNKNGIVGIDSGNVFGKNEKDNTHAGHERSAEEDGCIAGVTGAKQIAASNSLPDADSRGGGNAQWHHVGERDGVQSNLVAGEGNSAKAGDERSNGGENADFGGELDGGRET